MAEWTIEQLQYLKDNYGKILPKDMEIFLNRNSATITRKASYLGLTKECAKNIYIIKDSYAELIVDTENNTIVSKIDVEDISKLKNHTWNIGGNGYLSSRINNKNTLLHRHIYDEFNSNICFDHINLDKLDNRKINIRKCTKAENNQNRSANHSKNTTGFRGVQKCKDKYVAKVKHKEITIILEYGVDKLKLSQTASFARAYLLPFSEDALTINKDDIPQWIKDKIDRRFNV